MDSGWLRRVLDRCTIMRDYLAFYTKNIMYMVSHLIHDICNKALICECYARVILSLSFTHHVTYAWKQREWLYFVKLINDLHIFVRGQIPPFLYKTSIFLLSLDLSKNFEFHLLKYLNNIKFIMSATCENINII